VTLNRKKFNTLEKGMFIQNRVEQFVPVKVCDDQMGIMIPDSFDIMPEEHLKVKYPSEFRPEIILTSDDLSVNLGFTHFKQESTEDELIGVADQLKKMLARSSSEIMFFRQEIIESTNCMKLYYDFRSQALDEAIYNVQFLTLINSRIMFGMFNCLHRHTDEWYDAAIKMIESVVDMTKSEE
jgi:hypothetical protein